MYKYVKFCMLIMYSQRIKCSDLRHNQTEEGEEENRREEEEESGQEGEVEFCWREREFFVLLIDIHNSISTSMLAQL